MAAAAATYITKCTFGGALRHYNGRITRTERMEPLDQNGRKLRKGEPKKTHRPTRTLSLAQEQCSAVASLMSELLNALDGRVGRSVGLVALMPHLRVWIWLPIPIQSRECV